MKRNSDTAQIVSKRRDFMDRIICDICGSAYPQTADQCPICGYPRQGGEKAAIVAEKVVHAKVKGGRFSNI